MLVDIRSLSLAELEQIIINLNEKKFRANQIFSQIHKKGVSSINKLIGLPQELRTKLNEHFQISVLKKIEELNSSDNTKKYLWGLADGEKIESVLLTDKGRRTICLSTQVGCKMGCIYCATGKIKFKRNLSAGEIVSQVIQIEAENGTISNLVYMGMGEPFDNYDQLLKSIRILNHPLGKNIGQRKITISTCGLISEINRFAQENLQVRLAVSLNSAFDEIRSELMPINKKYPLNELIFAIKNYNRKTGRRITIEYVLLSGKNDSRDDAITLAKLLKGIKTNINLIPCNYFLGSYFKRTDAKKAQEFNEIMQDAGFEVSQRFRRGESIGAACGQLTGKYEK